MSMTLLESGDCEQMGSGGNGEVSLVEVSWWRVDAEKGAM